jgi:murein DD-endopeptidase MepM/ murein hydrolase activator NlpD
MKMIQKILKQIVGYLVDLVESIIEILQPIFEMIGPLLEQLFELLKPFLEMITNMVNKLIVPLTALMQVVVVPILQSIANSVEFIWGLLEVGFGNILRGIGTLCIITGFIPKLFGVGALFDTGKVFIEEGNTHVQQGSEHVKTAMASQFELYKSFLTGDVAEKKEQEPERETKYRNEVVSTLNGSPMDGIYGSGDVYNIYGAAGANQNMFGNYMNMGARGCGPVALADAYARRSGSPVNARTLTSAMSASGAYNPNMGTSVAGFVNAAGSMGMGLRAGGVTPASLKQATPNNPITIVGSGTDFTTRRGNNHYMNVVGTSGGTAYVSNPMNGRIERRSVTSLAANSLVGLYGSGDNIPKMDMSTVYGSGDVGSSISGSSISFSDEVQEALSVLKDLVSGIVGMFTGEESMESQLETEKNKAAYDKTMVDLGSLTDEEKQALENKAFESFKNENPRFENETDVEYEKRFRKENTYKRYMTKAATNNLYDATKKTAGSYDDYFNELLGEVDAETGERSGGSSAALLKSLTEKDQSVQQGAFFSKLQDMIGDYWDEEEESGFYSDNGARLYTDEYTPSVFDTSDAVNWKKSKGQQPDIPLIEWLKYNMPEMYGMSSAYKRYGTTGADAEVQGLDGADHTGTDFAGPEGTPIRAFTDGVVTWKGFDDSGGNMIVIEDVGGDLHKYMHMMEPSELTIGDEVFGGDVIGYIGNTGNSTGPHLHYQIQTNDNSMLYNPHTFFKWYEGSSSAPYGPIDFTGQLGEGNIWDSYKNRTGVSKFMQTAFDAGLTGPEVATITSTGIWEDGGEKLWGSKSLLDTTYDVNGQAARGIMNWVDPNVDYGNTVGEQLQYIQRTYFDGDSTDFRAQVRDTGFDAQDLAAYNTATGRNGWVLNYGDLYGPYMNEEDLVEGSEHFFRGALVPGCIHTVEGPRKYIGTAVGVYNWLLDEGYIDNYGDASNINYGSYVEVPTSLTENNGFGLMAANDAYQSAIDQTDKTDGTPYRYSETSSGKTGTAYNKAGQKLFDYYVPVKNANADKHWVDKHDYTKHIANFGNGKFVEIYIDKNGYALTTAGSNAKALIEKYDNDKNIKNNANTPGIISTLTSDSDLRKIWRSIYTRYSADYANQLSRGDMIADFNSGRATHNGMTVYYDTSDGNLYYKNYKSAGKIKVAGGQVVWPDVSPAQTNTGTNVINGGNVNNTSTTTTTTTVVPTPPTEVVQTNNGTNVINTPETSTSTVSTNTNEHSAAVSYIDAMNEWHERTFGSGDTKSVQVYGGGNGLSSQLDNMFSIDSYMPDQTSPVIVNNYPVDTTNSDVIDMLMSNTYNIRSKEIESLLTGMLQMMKDRKSKKQSSSTKTRTSKQSSQDVAFPEQGIPRQVTRLSIG